MIVTVLAALVLALFCGWFQYWMARWLEGKRWLLWLQPCLTVLMGLCFLAWSLSLNTPPWAAVPFLGLLAAIVAGWIVGGVLRRRPPKED